MVHPGATAASRRWPEARFAEVARRACGADRRTDRRDRHGCRAAARRSQFCIGAAHPALVPMAGVLGLGEMAALIERADLLVSNNSGPVHVAAATGTPVVDLYALANPQHTPWQVPHRTLFADVPCRYCYKSTCPQGITAACSMYRRRQWLAPRWPCSMAMRACPWSCRGTRMPDPAPIGPIEAIAQETPHVHAWH